MSKKVWNTDCITKLKQMVYGFIRIGEHLFTGEESCRKFLNEVRERGQKEPAYLLGFIKDHKDALDTAVKSFPGIKNAVTDLYSNGDELVLFGEHIFHNSAEFATFIDSIITKGCNAPDYLVRFTDFHHQEISELHNKDTLCHEVLNKLMNTRDRIVSFDEYIFPTIDEFKTFMDKVLLKGQQDPSYLKRFIKIHEKTLTVLNEIKTLSHIVKPVLNAGNEVIELDEYTFSNAGDFNNFVSELSSKDLNKTPRLSNFAKKHHDSLVRLENNASIADQVKTILRAENVIEKEKAISINGIIFNPFTIPVTIKKGDIIKFGDYPQDNYGGESPIEWLVLDVKNDEAFLISHCGLDIKKYNDSNSTSLTSWENSDLREWLNNDFIKSAFSEQEAKRIKVSDLKNNDSSYNISGNDTKDRIFCLSVTEAEQYFTNNKDRICKPTDHALKKGASSRNNGCFWWLRTLGMHAYYERSFLCGEIKKEPSKAAFVYPEGEIGERGGSIPVGRDDITVRPALRIIL